MSDRLFERSVREWLEDGSDRTPPAAIEAVLFAVKTTPQQRDLRIPRRFTLMPAYLRYAAAAAIVAIVGVGALAYNMRPPGIGTETPPATTSPTNTPSSAPPSVAPTSTPPGEAFTSPLYGYTVVRPAGWKVTPATVPWPFGADPNPDLFEAPASLAPEYDYVYVAAQPLPEGLSPSAWQLAYAEQVAASGRDCKGNVDAWTDATVGFMALRRLDLDCEGLRFTEVTFVIDGTGYVMAGNRQVIADFLEGFRAAADGVSFTSPLYGYSVTVPAGWRAVEAASGQWPDAGVVDTTHPEWFDVFPFDPTANDVGFVGIAAQPIPDGMTPETWMRGFAERQAASNYACKGPVDGWVDATRVSAQLALTSEARRIDVTCEGDFNGEDFTGWRYAYVVFVLDGTGYVVNGGPEGLDQLLDSFHRPASG